MVTVAVLLVCGQHARILQCLHKIRRLAGRLEEQHERVTGDPTLVRLNLVRSIRLRAAIGGLRELRPLARGARERRILARIRCERFFHQIIAQQACSGEPCRLLFRTHLVKFEIRNDSHAVLR